MTAPLSMGMTRATQEVTYGSSAATLRLWPEIDGALVVPSVCTVSVSRPGQLTPEISGASCTIAASGECTYALNASSTATYFLGENYRAEFVFTYGGSTHTVARNFDVVRTPLLNYPPCNVDELRGVAKAVDDMLTNSAQLTTAARFVVTAWVEECQWVRAQGKRVSLVSDATVFSSRLKYRALELLMRSTSRADGDTWAVLEKKFADDAEKARANLTLKYDEADARSPHAVHAMQQPRMFAGPNPDEGGGIRLRWRHM